MGFVQHMCKGLSHEFILSVPAFPCHFFSYLYPSYSLSLPLFILLTIVFPFFLFCSIFSLIFSHLFCPLLSVFFSLFVHQLLYILLVIYHFYTFLMFIIKTLFFMLIHIIFYHHKIMLKIYYHLKTQHIFRLIY